MTNSIKNTILKSVDAVKEIGGFVLEKWIDGTPVGTAKMIVSEAIAKKIEDEATVRAYQIMVSTHKEVTNTIIWQNGLLLASVIPVYFLKSGIPFYSAHTIVFLYSMYAIFNHKEYIFDFIRTKSILRVIQNAIRSAIDDELKNRHFYEQKVVEYLGPNLDKISSDIAQKLKSDIRNSIINICLTLVVSFIAFRLIVIPMCIDQALHSL